MLLWPVWNDTGELSWIRRWNILLLVPGGLSYLQHCSTWSSPVNHLRLVYWGWKEREWEIESLWNAVAYVFKNSHSFTSTFYEGHITWHSQSLRVPWLLLFFLMCKKKHFYEIRASAVGAAVEQPFQLASSCGQALMLYLLSFLNHYKAFFLINLATKHLEKYRLILPTENISDKGSNDK